MNNHIRALREAKGWTQGELAEAAGLSDSTISAYERGTREWTGKALQPIARALGVRVDMLLSPGEENRLTSRELLTALKERLMVTINDEERRKKIELHIEVLSMEIQEEE